jgi:hypothetical protein
VKPLRRSVNPLRSEDAAYIAGLIDGEGTITLTREHRNEGLRLVVSIANTERELLRFVCSAVGAGRITRKRTTSDAHTPSFAHHITSRQALDLLAQLLPYLRSCKALRAQLAVASYLAVTPRNGRYTGDIRHARQAFEEQFLNLCAKRQAQKGHPANTDTPGGFPAS